MPDATKEIVIAATFTADFLLPSLQYYNQQLNLGLSFEFVPYNQVMQQLLAPDGMMNLNSGMKVVLLRLADWLRFQEGRVIQVGSEPISPEEQRLLEFSYQAFMAAIQSYASRNQTQTLIMVCPSVPEGSYAGDWEQVFARYREQLETGLNAYPAIKLLDTESFHKLYQVKRVYDSIGDSMGHIPYVQEYVHFLGTLIIRYYYGIRLTGRKVIVVDCDNTIWNGVCGEAGAPGINWDGNAGQLQQFLANQSRQGMLLCLCSKNVEDDVWPVFAAHPDMPLQREQITAARINWEPKSENIKALAAELNLGLDSFIFIDDNPVECSEVRLNCPGVLTIPWPPPGDEPVRQLTQLWIFDHFTVTAEDQSRTRMYQAEINRQAVARESRDFRQFIAELKLEVEIEPVSADTMERASQLTMRTNQFNFTTIRRTVGELQTLARGGDFGCYLARVQDRFGAYGIVGATMFFRAKNLLTVDTFLLSCRVLGRGVEHRMIQWIAGEAARSGIKKIRFLFQDSERNLPAKQFLNWLSSKYSGVPDSEFGTVFNTKKLLSCRYTSADGPGSLEIREDKIPAKSSKVPRPENNAALIDFWYQNRTVDLIAAGMDVFRKGASGEPALNFREGSRENPPSAPTKDVSISRREMNRNQAVQVIRTVFDKYTTASSSDFSSDFRLETLALESKDIVAITSELYGLFGNVPTTLLFECQTFGAICECILGKDRAVIYPDTGIVSPNRTGDDNFVINDAAARGTQDRDIAIIGISGRFPDAANVYEFWDNLVQGKCSIREIPMARWDPRQYFSPTESDTGKSYNKWGGFLAGIDKFDAAFFQISPRQAALMDPQQRLLLEVVWNLLEDAGYDPERFSKKTGVFVGAIASDYGLYQNCLSLNQVATFRNCDYYQIANRISYFFDFHGPSLVIDTACSASGTAIHLACESLLTQNCDCAIAGGVNLVLHPSRYIQYSHAGMMSRDNLCRPFGENASGMIIGEGIGALLLKPYQQALEDGDHIWGVIKGSAINSGGRTTGFTVPNPLAQSEVIGEALRISGIDPATISYVEAHGTGTALGDPIEIKGLETAFEQKAGIHFGNQCCAIGSVKSNIGHLESAAAIAGIIKVLLQMKYQTLVPSLHAEVLNPKIDFTNSPFTIQRETAPWRRPVLETSDGPAVFPLRSGISSFGAGGSNAHIIVEEAAAVPEKPPDFSSGLKQLILLSARDEAALSRYARRLLDFLTRYAGSDDGGAAGYRLEDIAYTLRMGRKAMEFRLAIVAASYAELITHLEWFGNNVGGDCRKIKDNNEIQNQEVSGSLIPRGIYRGRIKQNPELLDLISGNGGLALAETLIKENNMDKLAQYWIAGGEIPENFFDYSSKPRRISLPGYPFDGGHFWMEGINQLTAVASSPATGFERDRASQLSLGSQTPWFLFQKAWRKVRARGMEKPALPPKIQGDVLIIGDHPKVIDGLLQYIKARATELGRPEIWVTLLTTAKDLPPLRENPSLKIQRIDSYGFEECSTAMNRILLHHRSIGHVIHLGLLGPDGGAGIEKSLYPVFAIVQQLLRSQGIGPCQWLTVCEGNREAAQPYWEGLSGLGKTIREEQRIFDFRVIFVGAAGDGVDGTRRMIAAIADELFYESLDTEVCYDGLDPSEKWIPDYQRLNLNALPEDLVSTGYLPREGAVYLITGGIGGIGMAVARYLASKARCNIVLCGRSPLDAEKMVKLKELRDTGAVIDYHVADVSDKPAVDQLIITVKKQYGKINGIFHLAGVIRDSYIIKKEKSDLDAVLGPKIRGCLWLDEATQDEDLDFFMLCSSLSGVIGNIGQSDYAYANSFLDSFSRFRNQRVGRGVRKGFTTAIAWPYWQDGGMKMSPAALELFTERTGLQPLPAVWGMEILKTVLNRKLETAIPVYGDPERFSLVLNTQLAASDESIGEDGGKLPAELVAASTPQWDEARFNQFTKEFLRATLGEVVNMQPGEIGEEDHFETLGIDSISVRLFSHRIEKKIGKVSPTLLYECQSLNDLISYFSKHYEPQLRNFFDRENAVLDDQNPRFKKVGNDQAVINPDFGVISSNRTRNDNFAINAGAARGTQGIAIIGMSGCFPLAEDLKAYWNNLKNGRDCVTMIPPSRWDNRKYYAPDPKESIKGKYYCGWGGFLDSVLEFDPLFFNIAPKEARAMDPQERLFLQLVWMALEDAGYNREALHLLDQQVGQGRGASVGVFVGVTANDYQLLGAEMMGKADVIGHSLSWSIANRISYCLNLTGPSIPVDGACSSSLMAVHLACESLKRGECQAAIAGAVHLNLHPFKYILNSQQRMLSSKGRCFAFGAEADGFVPGEGGGALVLKQLDQALRQGDHIYAIIKGSAINHGGRSNGYMVPNPEAQAEVVEKALAAAGVNPRTVSYIEAHGTGTILGDPIEIEALTKVFRKASPDRGYCSIGSVKANIGHAEAAAGIASLCKVILQMRNRWIVPALYTENPNPNIDFVETPFFPQPEGACWRRPVVWEAGNKVEYPRRAGVSSFGAGGANAHIVVEEYGPVPAVQDPLEIGDCYPAKENIVILSAVTKEQLREYARKLQIFLREEFRVSGPGTYSCRLSLMNLAYTLQVGREELKERLAVVVSTLEELLCKLEEFCEGNHRAANIFIGTRGSTGHIEDLTPDQAILGKSPSEIARLWVEGQKIDWRKLYADAGIHGLHRLPLPTYPFSRRKYGIESVGTPEPVPEQKQIPDSEASRFELTGVMTRMDGQGAEFTVALSLEACDFLKAHILFGKAVLSGPTQLAMLIEAIHRSLGTIRVEIKSMDFIRPIVVTSKEPLVLKLRLSQLPEEQYRFQFQSRPVQGTLREWEIHSAGLLTPLTNGAPQPGAADEWSIPELKALKVEAFYRKLEDMGYRFEDSFKCITDLKAGNGFAASIIKDFARLGRPGEQTGLSPRASRANSLSPVAPGMIDSCIQMLLPTLPETVMAENPHSIYVPVYVGGFTLWDTLPEAMVCYSQRRQWDDKRETLLGSILMKSVNGEWLGKIDKFRLKRVDSGKLLER
ncbi:MAG TPA: HAD-IIIC family phosphatase [Bacillota bacterium]|nr:HAD-IIIC family phosphatase [Bacillota bacterium]